ncbi:MAG: GC-type dockerin domain-anchored protein [Phycisphaerales bacterium]
MHRTRFILLVDATLIVGAGAANAVVLDIDSLPSMVNIPGFTIPDFAKVSNQFASQGVLISSVDGFAALVGGGGVPWLPPPQALNGLGGSTALGTLAYNVPIDFTFVNPANPAQPATVASFSLYTDYIGDGGTCSLVAFDANGAIVDSDIKPEEAGVHATGTPYAVRGAGIAKVEFIGAGTQAISNIEFDQTPSCPADLTGDGAVDASDLGILLGAWGTSGGSPNADITGDGVVDAADLGTLLGAWGTCA